MDALLLHPTTVGGKLLLMVIAIALFALIMALVLFLSELPKRLPSWVTALIFLLPALALVCFGLIYPALVTIKNSFFDETSESFVGLANFGTVLTDSDFLTTLRNTLAWVVLVPVLSTGIGLIYAVLVDRAKVEKVAKTLIFMPMAISMVGASIIWKFVYDNRVGSLSRAYVAVAGWFGDEDATAPQWLMNAPWNTFFLMIVMIWIQAGFAMTVLSASIKAIPDDIVEAGKLDGLTGIKLFRWVTVPMIRPALVVVMTTVAMTALKAFDIVRTMQGRLYHASVVANDFYTQSFNNHNKGVGAALAVLLFVIVVPVIAYNVNQLRKAEDIR
ncbi:MAG: sugar ABC transporter permease [Bifidobacteriaceae bacterium]|jgi:alpha-glucoside transport system permease protein|nr:sugar ABC transporter permease [Bifidobacteriaceae bacterium]